MEGVKPAPSATNSVATPAALASAEPSSSSPSIVAQLFGKPALAVASSGGIFDAIFNAPTQRVGFLRSLLLLLLLLLSYPLLNYL